MKQVTIISGKGGTGKTTIASSFIKLASNHIAVDCDVDAANLHILLEPQIEKEELFSGSGKAHVMSDCVDCGKCINLCRFGAIYETDTKIEIDPAKCESCGVCIYICPYKAIELVSEEQGKFFISATEFCPFVHARLKPGAENSGMLVTRIRNIAEDIAYSQNKDLIIIDGAPGIGCSVTASLTGADFSLMVVEPSISAISDFKKVYELVKFLHVKPYACINKFDINIKNTEEIERFCTQNKIEMAGRIPYNEAVPKLLARKNFIIDFKDNPAAAAIIQLWDRLKNDFYG